MMRVKANSKKEANKSKRSSEGVEIKGEGDANLSPDA
ncbi:hypothetical protein MEZE111188_05235 [Mesobacillus zeae]